MVNGHPKPRYSGQMESGVLVFVASGNTHGKRYGVQSGNNYNGSSTITHTKKLKRSDT